jgi:hypothetical protein
VCARHARPAHSTQEHQNEDLYEKAVQMLETYFECEDGDDQNLAPQLAGNQYAFGQQAAQVRAAGAVCAGGLQRGAGARMRRPAGVTHTEQAD